MRPEQAGQTREVFANLAVPVMTRLPCLPEVPIYIADVL
jgi:hypothetical protein